MRFIRHATLYTVVVLALLLIDALGGGGWWFFYVAAIWGIVLALHHEAWRDKTAIGEISYTLQIKMAVVNSVCFSDTHLHF